MTPANQQRKPTYLVAYSHMCGNTFSKSGGEFVSQFKCHTPLFSSLGIGSLNLQNCFFKGDKE